MIDYPNKKTPLPGQYGVAKAYGASVVDVDYIKAGIDNKRGTVDYGEAKRRQAEDYLKSHFDFSPGIMNENRRDPSIAEKDVSVLVGGRSWDSPDPIGPTTSPAQQGFGSRPGNGFDHRDFGTSQDQGFGR